MLPELRERLARIRDARQVILREAEVVKERVVADGGGTHARTGVLGREHDAADGARAAGRGEHPAARPRDRARGLPRRARRRARLPVLAGRRGGRRQLASARHRLLEPAPAVSARARVAVMGATAEDPPPGIGAIADTVELAFADDVPTLAGALEGTDVLFAWQSAGAPCSPGRGGARPTCSGSSRRLRASTTCCSPSWRRATSCSRTPAASTRTRSPSTSSG